MQNEMRMQFWCSLDTYASAQLLLNWCPLSRHQRWRQSWHWHSDCFRTLEHPFFWTGAPFTWNWVTILFSLVTAPVSSATVPRNALISDSSSLFLFSNSWFLSPNSWTFFSKSWLHLPNSSRVWAWQRITKSNTRIRVLNIFICK